MKSFIVFLLLVIIFIFCMQDMPLFQKTRNGVRFEYYKTVSAENVPPILAKYCVENGVKYSLYKIPNYVKDLLTYNQDFGIVYKSKPKFTIIILSPEDHMKKEPSSYSLFYNRINTLSENYKKEFNLISVANAENKSYPLKFDNQGLKGLKEYCGGFCLIDPSRDIMFTFKRISATETKALDVLFQQYSFMLN